MASIRAGKAGLVLVVDDDPVLVRVLKRALEGQGFRVVTAHDVPSALDVAEAVHPDYALVDVAMPGISGLWLVPALTQRLPGIHVVVLTGHANAAAAVAAMKAGACGFLAKPASTADIVAALAMPPITSRHACAAG